MTLEDKELSQEELAKKISAKQVIGYLFDLILDFRAPGYPEREQWNSKLNAHLDAYLPILKDYFAHRDKPVIMNLQGINWPPVPRNTISSKGMKLEILSSEVEIEEELRPVLKEVLTDEQRAYLADPERKTNLRLGEREMSNQNKVIRKTNLERAAVSLDRIVSSCKSTNLIEIITNELPILKQYFYNNDGPILEPGSVVTTNGEPRPVLLPKYNLSTIEKAQMFDRLLGVIHGFRALRIGFYEAVDPELSDYIITGYDSKGDEYTLGHTKSFEKGIEALEKTLVLLDIKCPEAVARDQLFNKAMNKTFETHGESLKKLADK